jgi:hypothetical protein
MLLAACCFASSRLCVSAFEFGPARSGDLRLALFESLTGEVRRPAPSAASQDLRLALRPEPSAREKVKAR